MVRSTLFRASLCCCLVACSSKPSSDANAITAGSAAVSPSAAGASEPAAGSRASRTSVAGAAGTQPPDGAGNASPRAAGHDAGAGPAAGAGGAIVAAGSGGHAPAGSAAGAAAPAADGCSRDALKGAVDAFYAAIASHATDKLSLAANVKYTENAKTLMPGEGVWKTAGMVKFKRTAVDTMTCMSATESVIPDGMTDRVYGVRLKLDADDKLSEIETILVTDYILIMPQGLVNSKNDDWETLLPADKQMPRDKLQAVMDKYLKEFPSGACGFAKSCTRLEDGGSVGSCVDGSLVTCNMMGRMGSDVLKPRLHVIDVEAGITVGFTIFLGGYDDFHLFKVRDGEVQSVHAVLTQTDNKTGWE